jgi:uncharacterized protein (UPF0332 family)
MLEDKSSRIIRQLIADKVIVAPKEGSIGFFMQKSRDSIMVASRLMELEAEEDLPSELWVINSSYYSMFFAATALLAKFGHSIKTEAGIHKLTYHALVYFFINQESKLKNSMMDAYKDAVDEAEELLQLTEKKVESMVKDFGYEMSKRKIFTYELGKKAELNKAQTSLNRAKSFVKEVEMLI